MAMGRALDAVADKVAAVFEVAGHSSGGKCSRSPWPRRRRQSPPGASDLEPGLQILQQWRGVLCYRRYAARSASQILGLRLQPVGGDPGQRHLATAGLVQIDKLAPGVGPANSRPVMPAANKALQPEKSSIIRRPRSCRGSAAHAGRCGWHSNRVGSSARVTCTFGVAWNPCAQFRRPNGSAPHTMQRVQRQPHVRFVPSAAARSSAADCRTPAQS